jgi:hypothetical protein
MANPPPNVYWSPEAGNFYDVQSNRGKGLDFYHRWESQHLIFPQVSTTVPGLDTTYEAVVEVLHEVDEVELWKATAMAEAERGNDLARDYRTHKAEIASLMQRNENLRYYLFELVEACGPNLEDGGRAAKHHLDEARDNAFMVLNDADFRKTN